jgi:cytochrome c oxidase subunit 3
MKTSEVEKNVWEGGVRPMVASYGKLMMWFFLLTDALTFAAFLGSYGFHRFVHTAAWPVPDEVFTHFPFLHGDHPLLFVALMTFILIMSSVTMVLAVHHGNKMNKKGVILWLGLTIIGGVTFLGSQAWEWSHFIHGTHEGAWVLADGSIAHSVDGTMIDITDFTKTDALIRHGDTIKGQTVQDFLVAGKSYHGASLKQNEYGHKNFGGFFFFITGFHGFHVFSGVVILIIIFINVLRNTYEKRGHYEMIEKVGLYWHFVDLVWVFVFTFFYLV